MFPVYQLEKKNIKVKCNPNNKLEFHEKVLEFLIREKYKTENFPSFQLD